MYKLLLALVASVPIFAQPACVNVSDSNVWGLGGAANGRIVLHFNYSMVSGVTTVKPSDITLTVVNGTLFGPSGTPGYCAPAQATITATYYVNNVGMSGVRQSTAYWTIQPSGDPLLSQIGDVTLVSIGDLPLNQIPGGTVTVGQIETAVPMPTTVGCYQLLVASSGASTVTSLPLSACH